ncbi:DNA helicase [Tanacetum coccineum]
MTAELGQCIRVYGDEEKLDDVLFELESSFVVLDGPCDASYEGVIYTVEFRKRGLPHCHVIISLHDEDKLSSPEKIDKFISTGLPSKDDDPIGFEDVRSRMIHGPCGAYASDSSCMNKGECMKGFLKHYCELTYISPEGWPQYARTNNRREANVCSHNIMLDNRYAVPHNRDLLVKYDCHINVEWCNQGSLVNRTTYESLLNNDNEIEEFLNCRYVSACEACWKIFNYDLHYRSIAVERLPFHEEECNKVYFRDNDDPKVITERISSSKTKFTEWMVSNQMYPEGHIYYVTPAVGEKFYLRMLLNIMRGARSHEEIRTVDRVVYPTYMATCKAFHFLADIGQFFTSSFPYLAPDVVVLSVASSGIASLLLPGGHTSHSRFCILVNLDKDSCCAIDVTSDLIELIKDICKDHVHGGHNKVSGGKVLVLGGDFRQILIVVTNGTRFDVVTSAVNKSDGIWRNCRVYVLSINMRLRDPTLADSDVEQLRLFTNWLLDMGDGRLPAIALDGEDEATWITIPGDLLLPVYDNPIDTIVAHTFPNLVNRLHDINYLKEHCILCSTNDVVDGINSNVLEKVLGELHELYSADNICQTTNNLEEMQIMYPTEFLNMLHFSGIPNHKLELKVRVPIILLRNLDMQRGDKVLIHRIDMTPTDSSWPFQFRRRQFPVKVCFDERRCMIHAKIPVYEIAKFENHLQEGRIYKISKFKVLGYGMMLFRPLAREVYVQFSRYTRVVPSSSVSI